MPNTSAVLATRHKKTNPITRLRLASGSITNEKFLEYGEAVYF